MTQVACGRAHSIILTDKEGGEWSYFCLKVRAYSINPRDTRSRGNLLKVYGTDARLVLLGITLPQELCKVVHSMYGKEVHIR